MLQGTVGFKRSIPKIDRPSVFGPVLCSCRQVIPGSVKRTEATGLAGLDASDPSAGSEASPLSVPAVGDGDPAVVT
jgi:hypothetical protein